MSFSKFIKDYREQNKLNQSQVAERFGVSNTTINDIEIGKTTFPNPALKEKIDKIFGIENSINTTYRILFNEKQDPGYIFEEKYKKFLAIRKNFYYHIDIDYPCKTKSGNKLNLLAVLWLPKITYYKLIVANYNRNSFLKALNSLNKNPDALIHAIISETKFFEDILHKTQYKEIRFILDKNNKDDRSIFKEISKIKMENHGKLADISFQLFDAIKGYSDKDIYYVTDHSSISKIDLFLSKMIH